METRNCYLIDDDEDDLEIFAMALENANNAYSCITSKNAKDAIKVLTEKTSPQVEFIFVDLNMPYMSGKEFLEQIKQDPKISPIPVIVYTTSSYEKDVEDTKLLGAAHFLVKPPSMNTLTNVLKDILNKKEMDYYINIV